MRAKLLLFIVFIGFTHLTRSQTLTITGKVTSKEEDKGIPGVTVSPKDTLKFSFIGYETRDRLFNTTY